MRINANHTKYLIAIIAALLAGCKGQPQTETPAPETESAPTSTTSNGNDEPTVVPTPELVIVALDLGRRPETIDPALVAPRDGPASDMVENLFIGLTHLDPDTGEVTPWLAKEWQIGADGLTWTVFLRDDIFWVRLDPGSGQMERVRPVTAGDVVAAVQRGCRSETKAPLARALWVIEGCRQVYQATPGSLSDGAVAAQIGARILNDVAVEFKLEGNPGLFLAVMAMPVLRPIPADLVESTADQWTLPENMWTSGAFTVQPTFPLEDGYTLIANQYWPFERSGNVNVAQVSFNGEAAFTAWVNGAVDVATLPPGEIAGTPFDDDPRFRRLALPAETMIVFNYDTPPFENPDVRRALSLGLDREAIIEQLGEAGAASIPALTLTPPGMASAPRYGETGVRFDAAAARVALSEAGFSNCNGLPDVTLLTDESTLSQQLAEAYVASWVETLGCAESAFTIEQQPHADVLTALRELPSGRRDVRAGMATLGWQADIFDAGHWLADIVGCRDLFPEAFLNQARECGQFDSSLQAAAGLTETTPRLDLYRRIDEALFGADGEMPVMPVYFHARGLAIQPWMEVYPIRAGALRIDAWVVDEEGRP